MSLKDRIIEVLQEQRDICSTLMDRYLSKSQTENFQMDYNLPTPVQIDSHGGEGEGTEYWTIWKFSEDGEDVLVQFFGSYASHYGTEYEGFSIVEPYEYVAIGYNQVSTFYQ